MDNGIMVGQIVKSKSGRDKDRYFLVSKVLPKERTVFLVDGEKRFLENPKKKNLLHIQMTKTVAKELAEKIQKGSESCDQEIKRYLKELQVD
ncbi:MAG: KOW domain-containing RNA-binding protein [Dehalobacterium sp.]